MENFDILLTDTEELQADSNYDFKVDDCSNKYIKYILVADSGHYRLNPIGVGIYKYINSNASPAQIERAIRSQLESDVFDKPSIDLTKFPVIYVDKIQADV